MEKHAMTQEELDALMAGDMDLDEVASEEESVPEHEDAVSHEVSEDKQEDHYRVEAGAVWPPPPPTNDHQVVNQLDDVTKASEIKATEIFDKLELINNITQNIENSMSEQIAVIESNIDIFERLASKFTTIESFQHALEENQKALSRAQEVVSEAQSASDEVMLTMDVMQYQDIHRQKIERVINVMRALSGYMNMLFHSNVEDSSRVGSAIHIEGDGTEDVASADDIEALIASFGKKD
jgi:hypothetical protein